MNKNRCKLCDGYSNEIDELETVIKDLRSKCLDRVFEFGEYQSLSEENKKLRETLVNIEIDAKTVLCSHTKHQETRDIALKIEQRAQKALTFYPRKEK